MCAIVKDIPHRRNNKSYEILYPEFWKNSCKKLEQSRVSLILNSIKLDKIFTFRQINCFYSALITRGDVSGLRNRYFDSCASRDSDNCGDITVESLWIADNAGNCMWVKQSSAIRSRQLCLLSSVEGRWGHIHKMMLFSWLSI